VQSGHAGTGIQKEWLLLVPLDRHPPIKKSTLVINAVNRATTQVTRCLLEAAGFDSMCKETRPSVSAWFASLSVILLNSGSQALLY